MSINTKQITAVAANATFLITIPDGVCTVCITNGNNAAVIVGPAKAAANLSATNGHYVPSGQTMRFDCYASSKGCDLYAIVAVGGSSGPVSALVSTTD